MRVTITDRCRLWEIKDQGKYAEVKFSTSRKVKEDSAFDKNLIEHNIAKNGYVSTYYSFIRFVGKAYNKLKNIEENATLTNLTCDFAQEPYWNEKEQEVNYPRQPRITVYDFEIFNWSEQHSNGLDAAPKVEEDTKSSSDYVEESYSAIDDDSDDLPF